MKNQQKPISTHPDPRGTLTVVEHSGIPFIPARSFVVSQVPIAGQRGGHAHLFCRQFLVVAYGILRVDTDNGNGVLAGYTLMAGQSILLEPMVWATQKFMLPHTVLMTYCNHPYDEQDYIRNYEKFISTVEGANYKRQNGI